MIYHRKRKLTMVKIKNLNRKVSMKSKAKGFKKNSLSKFSLHSGH